MRNIYVFVGIFFNYGVFSYVVVFGVLGDESPASTELSVIVYSTISGYTQYVVTGNAIILKPHTI